LSHFFSNTAFQQGAKNREPKTYQTSENADLLDEKLWAATATRIVTSWADCDTDEEVDEVEENLRFGFNLSDNLVARYDYKANDDEDLLAEHDAEESEGDVDSDAEHSASDLASPSSLVATLTSAKSVERTKQLSKKELKQKELDDLEAAFAELGVDLCSNTNGIDLRIESKSAAKRRRKAEREETGIPHSKTTTSLGQETPVVDTKFEDEGGVISPAEAKRKLTARLVNKKKLFAAGPAAAVAEAMARAEKAKKKNKGRNI
jgi:hypothetical protein